MVLPAAAIPFLGILGAAGANVLGADVIGRTRGRMANAQREVEGRYNQSLNLDRSNPAAVAQGLFEGGLLSGQGLLGALTGQQSFDEQRRQFGLSHGLQRSRFDLANRQQGFAETQYYDQAIPTLEGPVDFGAARGALIGMESGGNPNAVSHKGAMGLGQIMPDNVVPWARKNFPELASLSDAGIMAMYQTDPSFQSELLDAEFGRYVGEYGLQEAYTKWHAGEGTDWQDVVRDYQQAQQTGGTGQYHDGNMHTYDYVRKNMAQYGRLAAENVAGRERESALNEAALAYEQEVQPMADAIAGGEWALRNLDKAAMSPDWWSSSDGARTTQAINQIILKQRNDYWRNELGRTDAPGERETEDLDALFPMITQNMLKKQKNRDRIGQNLRGFVEGARARSGQAASRFERQQGVQAPSVGASIPLPSGWTREQ